MTTAAAQPVVPSARSEPSLEPARVDALVFVPGLGRAEHMQPAHVAALLSWEMTQRSRAVFAARPASVDDHQVFRIDRIGDGVVTPFLDVYGVDTTTALNGRATSQSGIRRVVTLGVTVLAGLLIWVAAWARRNRAAKSLPQMLQLLFCLIVLLCLGVYFLTAVGALVQAVAAVVRNGEADGQAVVSWPQWVVLTAAVLSALFPGARERVLEAAELYRRAMNYLWTSGARNRLTSRLQQLVDGIQDKRSDVKAVHVVGFSFGSLVVLDTIFPAGRPNPARIRVDSITTIGCPFDLVRMLQPSYAEHRVEAVTPTPQWVNIYEPIDVLASNFNDGDAPGVAALRGLVVEDGQVRTPHVNLAWNGHARLNLVNFLMLQSLLVHSQYWDESVGSSALGEVVAALYEQSGALAPPKP